MAGKYHVKKKILWEGNNHPSLKHGDVWGLEVQGPKSTFGLTRHGNSDIYSRYEPGKTMGGKRQWRLLGEDLEPFR